MTEETAVEETKPRGRRPKAELEQDPAPVRRRFVRNPSPQPQAPVVETAPEKTKRKPRKPREAAGEPRKAPSVTELLKLAEKLSKQAAKARERAKAAKAKEAIGGARQTVKEATAYLGELEKEVVRATAALEKAQTKHDELKAKYSAGAE
jgi:hypothetical protein